MTRDETIKILAILKAAYPNSYREMTKEEANGTVAVWATQFANMPADVVMIAINKLISTNTFPPSINEVKDKIRGLYWESWMMLKQNERYNDDLEMTGYYLDEKTVARLKQIMDIVEPMRCRMTSEPTLEELLKGFDGYLAGGERVGTAQIE